MKKNTIKIQFGIPQCEMKDLKTLAFSDATLSNLPDKTSSTRSFVIFLSSNGKVAPLSWCSKKLERVAKTIIYAEGIALGRCLDEAVNLRQALLQILSLDRKMVPENTILPIVGVTIGKIKKPIYNDGAPIMSLLWSFCTPYRAPGCFSNDNYEFFKCDP